MSQMESISEWDAHRATIERLYLQEGRTLKNTMNIMDTTYGFHKKKGQYEYKFREWGLKKYPMGAAEWKYIKRQMETRKRESGKDSEVYINGVLQSPKKVRYEIGRQGFESTIAKFQEDPFPKAPFGVEIRTPIPFTSNTQFHHSFPWFEYSRRLPISTNWDVSASTENALNQSRLIKIMVFMIDSLLTKCPNDFEVHVRSIPRTSSVLNVLMPEEYDGQNTSIAANLMNTSRANFPECIRLLMFLLSNNIHLELYDPSAITIRPAKQAHMHIMEMLLVAGFLSEHNMRSLLRQRPTEGATRGENI